MFKKSLLAAGLCVCGLIATQANALVIDGSGNVTDWGIAASTFTTSNTAADANQHIGDQYATLANNYAPIYYKSAYNHTPSGGEVFDLEQLRVRASTGLLQVLAVASSYPTGSNNGGTNTYSFGDVFIKVGGVQLAIVSSGANIGNIYQINNPSDVLALTNDSDSWGSPPFDLHQNDYGPDATIPAITGPWAVSNTIPGAQLLGTATVNHVVHNYGGTEDSTDLLEYNITDAGVLALFDGNAFLAQLTYSCGNDEIRVGGVVPEPATVGLMMLGTGLMFIRRRRVKA